MTPFGGETYDREKDGRRLSTQLIDVRDLMLDGVWRTLREIGLRLDHPEASISARLRDLRKPKFGQLVVNSRRVPNGNGLHEYQLLRPSRRDKESFSARRFFEIQCRSRCPCRPTVPSRSSYGEPADHQQAI